MILLAAGASRRMGQPKLLMDWGGESVLARVAATFRQAGARRLAAVHAPGDTALIEELDRIGVAAIVNPGAPDNEMFHSVCCGLAWDGWTPDLTHLVLALGDMPAILPATLRALFQVAANHPTQVCQPCRGGRRGHPVVVPRNQVSTILSGQYAHLRAALSAQGVHEYPTDDAAIHADIDTPEDFQALKQASRG